MIIHIYTTNIVENLNSSLELVGTNTGGYFQSIKTTESAIYVTISKIKKKMAKNCGTY